VHTMSVNTSRNLQRRSGGCCDSMTARKSVVRHLDGVQAHGLDPQQAVPPVQRMYPEVVHAASVAAWVAHVVLEVVDDDADCC